MNQQKGFGAIIAIILTALIVGGGMYIWHLQEKNKDLAKLATLKVKVTTTVTPTIPVNITLTPSAMQEQLGVIEGSLIYPSSVIPVDMKVCAEKSDTKVLVKCTSDKVGDPSKPTASKFSLKVPTGSYFVYAALPKGFGGNPNYKAYYDEFVTCGLKFGCPSHKPLAVVVNAGETLKDIKPHDWYDDTQSPTPTP